MNTKEQINEEVLCVLRKNNKTNLIEIDFIDIEFPLNNLIDRLTELIDNQEVTLIEIINYIETNDDFNLFNAHYRYCESLHETYQSFTADNKLMIQTIKNEYQEILNNFNNHDDLELDDEILSLNFVKETSNLKQKILSIYIKWNKAFSINKAYRICHDDNSILTFSHRIDGWSNPVYPLTPNFSIELKTNFGFGHVSYFYTILRFKNIELTPLSEWIDYEGANFSEIIRYSQKYLLNNEEWLKAMEYSKEACNLSLKNEILFIQKFIIKECELMVSGLENILCKTEFTFKDKINENYKIDKKGHILISFRGEKISGALDFISKIIQYDNITSIQSFVKRIENCNKKIEPVLEKEIKILNNKIEY